MKRIFLACCLLTATFAAITPKTYAQASFTTAVDVTTFTAKVNRMDSLIGAGSMTLAQTTWNEIHNMLMAELAATKSEIAGATSATDRTTYSTVMTNQYSIYHEIWALKTDLATNRTTIKAKLLSFAGTI